MLIFWLKTYFLFLFYAKLIDFLLARDIIIYYIFIMGKSFCFSIGACYDKPKDACAWLEALGNKRAF